MFKLDKINFNDPGVLILIVALSVLLVCSVPAIYTSSPSVLILCLIPVFTVVLKITAILTRPLKHRRALKLCQALPMKKTVLVLSVGNEDFDKAIKKAEQLLSRTTNMPVLVATVFSPEDWLCLNGSDDTSFYSKAEEFCSKYNLKYNNRFSLFIRARQYDPTKKCYFSSSDPFIDLYDLLHYTDSNAFIRSINASSIRKAHTVITFPIACDITPSHLDFILSSSGGNFPMLEIYPKFITGSRASLYSFISVSYLQSVCAFDREGLPSAPSEHSLYVFRASELRKIPKSDFSYDILKNKLDRRGKHFEGAYAPCDISIFHLIMRQSRKISYLLNGFSRLSFKLKTYRIASIADLSSPLIAFVYILLSYSSSHPNLCIFLSLTVMLFKNIEMLCVKSNENYCANLIAYALSFILELSLLPFTFTVSCYLLLKKICSPFSGRPFKGIVGVERGIIFVCLLSVIILGALFTLFDPYPPRRFLAQLWLMCPIFILVLSLKTGYIRPNKRKKSNFRKRSS